MFGRSCGAEELRSAGVVRHDRARWCGVSVPGLAVLVPLVLSMQAWSQTTAPGESAAVTGPLVQLVDSQPGSFNQLEKLSAIANQASYNLLTANPNAAVYCAPNSTKATPPQCPQGTFQVFSNLRVLVQTANELLQNGQPYFYSLHTSDAGLGFALRWVAGENLAAPGSVATQFANGQLASIAGRLSALRLGARGFTASGSSLQQGVPSLALDAPAALGGAAGSDGDIGLARVRSDP